MMEYLQVLKSLQEKYQQKFAALLKLQEESATDESELDTPEYNQAKADWLQAGSDLKAHLEQIKN